MDFAAAARIYGDFRDTQWEFLKEDVLELAVRYARTRVDWLLADPEKQRRIEEDRTATHNAFIASCDILARNMAQRGEDNSWRKSLGNDRKTIGDFACYLHCILGISAR